MIPFWFLVSFSIFQIAHGDLKSLAASKKIEFSSSPIYFHCFGGNHNPFTIVESIHIKFDCIDPTTTNVVYFPDWYNRPSQNDSSVNKIYNTLLQNNINPIIVNYENILKPPENVLNSSLDLDAAIKEAKSKIPLLVARLIDAVDSPYHLYSLNNIRYVGFGLGAQIISRWARTTQTRPLRVTALDPIGSGLSKKDGLFLDILHTSKGLFNPEAETIGHVDVRANAESETQPGCIFSDDPLCSHNKAVDYFVESIENPQNFPLCHNGFDYLLDQCKPSEKMAYMGYNITDMATGNFYLSTNPEAPFGKGLSGLGTFSGAGLVSFDCYNGEPGSAPTSFRFRDLLANPFEVPSKLDTLCNPNPTTNVTKRPTSAFFFPDWTNLPPSQNDPLIQKLVTSLQKRNVVPIVLNYDSMLRAVVKNANQILHSMPALEILTAFSLYPVDMNQDVRFIGYGMGAQIVSSSSKVITRISKGNITIPRITALNPYGLKINTADQNTLRDDALFVDVIHTDAWGSSVPTSSSTENVNATHKYKNFWGHADFYPNFPAMKAQPDCSPTNFLCSHKRAIELYVESIENPKAFPSCPSGVDFLVRSCKIEDANKTVHMGYDVEPYAQGMYYLSTNSKRNFNLGKNGINVKSGVKIDPIAIPDFVFETENDLSFQCYKTSITNFDLLLFKDVVLPMNQTSKFDKYYSLHRNLIFYFPDWNEKPCNHEENIDNVVEGYLNKDITPIVVNYEKFMKNVTAASQTAKKLPKLQYLLALALLNFEKVENVRFVGFGTGAHIISAMSKTYTELTKKKLPRITALDPFAKSSKISLKNALPVLSKDDADFVDVIHTSFKDMGIKSFGHVDFYPNYPETNQPGCNTGNTGLDLICNHQRALDFYLASLKYNKAFPTCKRSILNLRNICTNQDDLVYMGFDVNVTNTRGLFYLKTNPKSPYYGFGVLGDDPIVNSSNNTTPLNHTNELLPNVKGEKTLQMTFGRILLEGHNLDRLGFHCYKNTKNPSRRYFISFKDILTKNITAGNFSKCTGNGKRTIIYLPDWNSNQFGPSITAISKAFLQRKIPTLVVNYQNLMKSNTSRISMPCNVSQALVTDMVPSYNEMVDLVPRIAEALAQTLKKLDQNKIKLSRGRFVGFGMGAQILSSTSIAYSEIYNGKKMRRITALDPSGPGFFTQRFNHDHVEFADVIHTNTKLYGFPEQCGHVDFYVNFPNTFQPGCFEAASSIYERDVCTERFAMCSHQRAWQFYVESLNNPKGFPACREKLPFLLDKCEPTAKGQSQVYMGFGVNTNATGVYYLRPNAEAPFGIGAQGLGAKKEAYSELRSPEEDRHKFGRFSNL